MSLQTENRLLSVKAAWPAIIILAVYLVVGSLYAAGTPIWQAPDEPAHYNYVRSLADGRGFPVMELGDYDQAYINRLTSERFPSDLSILSLEYEDHQPPLYYLLAVPVYWISGGSVLALRLFSLILGGIGIAIVFLILREVFPAEPGIAWFGGGVVAFIPQYVAIMASVNNDALLIVLLWLWLWLALRYLRGRASPWLLGLVGGALVLTKATGYGALPLTLLVIALRYRRGGMPLRWAGRQLLPMLLPVLVLGGVWWGRNVGVYGWPDVLGLIRHGSVVVGQPETADWIAQQGLKEFLRGAVVTTFRSFWGQFGWMGVVLDQRIYQGLAIFTVLTVLGIAWYLFDAIRTGLEVHQRDDLIVLGTAGLITAGLFVIYNFTFVQHQGRYLFPALPVLALGAAVGWRSLTQPRRAVSVSMALLAFVVVLGVAGVIRNDLPLWPLAMLGAALVAVLIVGFARPRWHSLFGGGWLAAMAALDLWCLFGFIIPMLSS